MPIIGSEGAASSGGFGQFARASAPTYIEDVFSTWLYTGNGSTQTITNGIDLSTKGGLVWIKDRGASTNHILQTDTTSLLRSNLTDAAVSTGGVFVTNFNVNGFSVSTGVNGSSAPYTSWTFRKQPKFFDVVTWTGNGANRTIAHNLGSVPGCIIVKRTDTTSNWQVYHRGSSLINPQNYMVLNTTAAFAVDTTVWNSTVPTSTDFSVGTNTAVNASGGTYVAYVFAHNAGGFGLTGSDNVISCGSYAGNGSATGPVVTTGYEPQWLMIKNASSTSNWNIIDNMRGMPVGSADATLQANLSNTESSVDYVTPTATGFQVTSTSTEVNTNGNTYIYIAIRRGPMKVPTDGTSVFGLSVSSIGAQPVFENSTPGTIKSQYVDLAVAALRNGDAKNFQFADLLRGFQNSSYLGSASATSPTLSTSSSSAEVTVSNLLYRRTDIDGFPSSIWTTYTGTPTLTYAFRRAPGFFDVVCYTGGSTTAIGHNLQTVPQMAIFRSRSSGDWEVEFRVGSFTGSSSRMRLNTNESSAAFNNVSSMTSSSFSFSAAFGGFNQAGTNYVAYLFASCPGVSKVGSYTGNGSSQTINCGFTGGARFVLIKRTDNTGDWYVWDTARGIVAGNDPRLSLNSTAAEVTTDDSVDTDSTGFVVNQLAATNINVTSATYIYLAIA